MAFCTNCGGGIPDAAIFCPRCGAPVPHREGPQIPSASSGAAPSDGAGVPTAAAGPSTADGGVPPPHAGPPPAGPAAAPGAEPPEGPPKRRGRLVLAIAAVVLSLAALAAAAFFLIPRGSGGPAEVDNRQAAEESIRAFAGRDVVLEYRGGETYLGGEQLRFTETTDAGPIDYYVDRDTHRVTRMDDFNTPAYKVKIEKSPAFDTAIAFAEAHFTSADVAELTLVEDELIDHGKGTAKWFAFTWVKKDPSSDALLPVAVSIRVDPVTGEVFSYSSLDVEVTVATVPQVDESAATQTALAELDDAVTDPRVQSATLAGATDPPNDPTGAQALVWQVVVRGDDETGFVTGAVIYVDALSGEVLDVEPFT